MTLTSFVKRVNHVIAGHLRWISRVTLVHPRLKFLISCLLIILSVFSISRIRFETDIFRLFPAKRPALALLLDSLVWSGGAREAYFLLEGDAPLLQSEAERFAGKLKTMKVDGAPAFKRVIYRIYEESEAESFTELLRFAVAHPAAFVAPENAQKLAQRFTPQGVNAAVQHLSVRLATSFGSAGQQLALADPLGLGELILPRLKSGSQALDMDTKSPYFLSRDGKVLIIIAEPAHPVQDMAFARKLVAAIADARKDVKVRISCAGAHISAVIDEAAMKSTILACIASSLVVVLGLFFAVYRRLLPTLMIPVILGVGVSLALGTVGLFQSSIHIISFAFMALIIGLGTDYSIHLYDRFHAERAAGLNTDQALQLAVVDTGHGLFTAAVTTALPFLTLGFSEVRALSELGLLVGLGVLFSLYATLFFMPPVLYFSDSPGLVYRSLPSLGLGRLWRFSRARSGTILIVSTVLVAILAVAALYSSFDNDLKNLQPRNSEAFRAQELVEQHLNLSSQSLLVAVDGTDLHDTLQRSASVEAVATDLYQREKLRAWSSFGQTINRPEQQQQIITQLAVHGFGTSLAKQFETGLLTQGFVLDPFQQYLKQLSSGTIEQVVGEQELIRRLAQSPLRAVVERHLAQDATGWHALTYLHYQPGNLDLAALKQTLQQKAPTARLTGTELVSQELLAAVKESFASSFSLGGLLVLLLLFAHFRNSAGIAAALVPVAIGAVAMLGAMVLFGMKLNFMNAMVLVTIVGMGSDYGLHIQHRITGLADVDQETQFVQASRAVLLSAITTIAGFGSLAFADYGAMSSIGWATNFGIGFTVVAALLMLPAALFQLQSRRRHV